MLFDLQGKRRRVIQATYLTLAVLMGGGLVLFGIGGDVQGGLFDAFSDRSEGGQGNPITERRLEAAEKRLRANPNDQAALAELTRARFQLAGDDVDPNTGVYLPEARGDLRAASESWERYLATDPKPPDASLARVMIQVYGFGLNQPAKASQAAELVAEADPTSQTFLTFSQYAALAGQKRKADLAGKRAIALAPPKQRERVKKNVETLEAQIAAQKAAAAGGGAAGAGGGGGAGAPGAPTAPGGGGP
jgi:hypothetical protein